MFMRSGYSQPTVKVFLATCSGLPVGLGPTAPYELGAEIEHRGVSAQQVRRLAFRRGSDQSVDCSPRIGLGRGRDGRSQARVLEAHCEVMGSVAAWHHYLRAAAQTLKVDIPDPGNVCAVGATVVQAEQEVAAAGKVDGSAEGLIESGRVLGKDEIELAALSLEALLPAERGAEGAETVGDEHRVQAKRGAGGECSERVVAVVQAAQRQVDTHAADPHRQAFEPIEIDVRRGQIWRGPGEISIGTAINAVVADVDGVEQ